MELKEAIINRRSIGNVENKEVPKEIIEEIIESAKWAPTRFLTQPWRFFVITKEGRQSLSKVIEEIAVDLGIDPNTEEGKKRLELERNKPFRAPVIIAVAAEVSEKERVIRLEELGAVYAGIQNMLLTAHSLGIAAYWKTGKECYHPKMKEFFYLKEKDEVLAFIYLGYSESTKNAAPRISTKELTTWIEY